MQSKKILNKVPFALRASTALQLPHQRHEEEARKKRIMKRVEEFIGSRKHIKKSKVKLLSMFLSSEELPENLRGKLWYLASGAKNFSLSYPKNYYWDLVN